MSHPQPGRIYLSPPHLGEDEGSLVMEAIRSNWIAPLGPHVDAFEQEFADTVGAENAVALSSGTAALHLGLLALGVGPGDDVVVSSLTFVASVNPILYVGARPILVDSEPESWNMDPDLLAEFLEERNRTGRLPAAVIPVHLYGQTADLGRILAVCNRYGIPLIEDAAEALGASWEDRAAGTAGRIGIYSFNGNKVITTSGGGMLVTPDREVAGRVRKLATQAREPAPYYEHVEVGYNYRLSNLLAAVGRGQLRVLDARVRARQDNFAAYRATFADLPGVDFMPEAPWGTHSRWLSVLTLDPEISGLTPDDIRLRLEAEDIEARPVWKPMHLQPLFRQTTSLGGGVSEQIFARGLCLPSGSGLTQPQRNRVIRGVREAFAHADKGITVDVSPS